jgi:CRISPR-associated protein (TIGR03986 family)
MSNEYNPGPRFVNPYNFVPLKGKCQRSPVVSDFAAEYDRKSGYLECIMTLKTPLFIPNTSNSRALHYENEVLGASYDFFSYNNLASANGANTGIYGESIGKYVQPVIPGSEIRGAIRSVYEAAFNGCMSSIELDRPLHRRSSSAKEPGILKQEGNKWVVVPCTTRRFKIVGKPIDSGDSKLHPAKVFSGWKENEIIFIEKKSLIKKKGRCFVGKYEQASAGEAVPSGYEKGFVHKGESFETKKYESIFVPDEKEGKPLPVSEAEITRLKQLLKLYRDKKKNRNIHGESWYSEFQLPGKDNIALIYYSLVYSSSGQSEVRYLSPSQMSKEVFDSDRIYKLLVKQGGYHPCKDTEVCPACMLFGRISNNDGAKNLGSRLRFEDAFPLKPLHSGDEKNYYFIDTILPELGEPKPGAVEFYTTLEENRQQRTNQPIWTYDYKIIDKKYQELKNDSLKLRGRKFYWHSKVKFTSSNGSENNAMRQKIRPLGDSHSRRSNIFRFRIYFQHLNKEELAKLRWALDFNDKDCAHKMGRGKPLGYGSAQLEVTGAYERVIDFQSGEWRIKEFQIPEINEPQLYGALEEVKTICNWERRPKNGYKEVVSYPIGQKDGAGKNAEASHQWFTANKKSDNQFKKTLPLLSEEVDNQASNNWLYGAKVNSKPSNKSNKFSKRK